MAVGFDGKKTFSRGRRILIAVNVTLMVTIALAIFFGVCYLASLPAFRKRMDLTREHSFTLSPLTLSLLETLPKEVKVISIFRQAQFDPYGHARVEREIGDYAAKLLEEYVIHSNGKVRLEVLNRDRDNLRVRELNEQIGLADENVVVFLCGENHTEVLPGDLAVIDAGGADPNTNVIHPAKILSFKAEAGITFAIQSVIEERKPKVYITTGRQEANPADSGSFGLLIVAEMLKRLNFEVKELKLYAEKRVPADADVLVIPGPKEDFNPEESAAVQAYLQEEGRLLIALSPASTSSLEEILANFNIGLNREITCMVRSVPLSREDRHWMSFIQTEHFSRLSRVTRVLAERGVHATFYKAGAVDSEEGDTRVQWLVRSPDKSWGDAHPPGKEGDYFYNSGTEQMAPRVLAVSVEGEDVVEGAKLVFFGDTYFYTNSAIQQHGRANLDLFTNAVNWLAARENLLEIAPKSLYVSQVDLTEEEFNRIGLYVVIIIPAIAAMAGLIVWWLRRR